MIRRALANLALVAALGFGVLSHPLPGHAEPQATPPTNDTSAVDWGDPSPSSPADPHAPSLFHRTYPAATQTARDWAWRRLGTRQWRCLDSIGHHESGWRPLAHNPRSGAHGIGQAVPAAKMRRFGSDYMTNPLTQTKWMVAYAHSRYGSACKAEAHRQRWGWW